MKHRWCIGLVTLLALACPWARAGDSTLGDGSIQKFSLSPDESVYAPPTTPEDQAGLNQGGVNFHLDTMYTTAYVYRGIDRSKVGGNPDAPDFQIDSALSFNLNKLPHPFVGVFVNVYNSDPVSHFQEIRPYFGLDWKVRPIDLEVGHNTYLYPNRDPTNTSEVYGKLTLDDSIFFGTIDPVLSPYILAAYDYDLYNGWYFEFGVSHNFVFEDYGLTITPRADASYVSTEQLYALTAGGKDSGFQHYEVGFTVTYSLGKLLDIPSRFGDFNVVGELFYDDGLDDHLHADTVLWGGVGIDFRY